MTMSFIFNDDKVQIISAHFLKVSYIYWNNFYDG